MLRLDNIAAQFGKQILFVGASAAIHRGEKVGLIGPNGAGKSTLFRYLMKEEEPDEGQVSIDRGVTIGYFRQDVGEMKGRPVLAEVLDGAGPVAAVAAELKELEHAMADPARGDELEQLVERFGEVQHRFDSLGGYALEGKAREILAGLGFEPEQVDGDVGALSGGWKMRVALARILLMRPDAMLLDEPSNHLDLESLIWLEHFLQQYEGALLMTSHDRAFINRICTRIIEIDGGELNTYSGNYDFYEKQKAMEDAAGPGRLRAPAGDAGEGDRLHRALQGARLARGPGAVAGEEAGEDRQAGGPQAPREGAVRVPPAAALGRRRGEAGQGRQGLRHRRSSTRASISWCAARSAGACWASTGPASPPCSSWWRAPPSPTTAPSPSAAA